MLAFCAALTDHELSRYSGGLPLGGEDDNLRWKEVEVLGIFDPQPNNRMQSPRDDTVAVATESYETGFAIGGEDGESK
jgi:hypothetical protein